jgi:predicted ester cyclase
MKNLIYLLIATLPLYSCMQKENNDAEKNGNNSLQVKNEQRMRDFYQQVINAHNPALIDSFCTADFVEHNPFPGQAPNIDGLKKGFSDYMAGFPDLNATVEMIKGWGDTCMTKFRMRGMNTGMFMGMPATGKALDIEGVDIVIIKDGKATQHWGYIEETKMLTQLGMNQETQQTGEKEHHD